MDISKYNLVKRDVGVQANLNGVSNATLDDHLMTRTFKETIDLEREFQSLMNENQLLK